VLAEPFFQIFHSVLQETNVEAYLCGGTVRDLLLNRPFRDVDVVLPDKVFFVAQAFRKKINAPYFVLDQERQIARVVCGGGNWDFSGFRNHTIEGDLKKRDFTINALAIEWNRFYPSRDLSSVLDPFGGLQDLQQRQIRTVAPQSLVDDPLRMLRAFRIRAELDFQIHPAVLTEIEQIHSLIQNVAEERITEELDRIFLQPDSAKTWGSLGNSSLLNSVLPELQPMKGCEQGGYHHLDVWHHTILALEFFEDLILRLGEFFPDHAQFLQEYLDSSTGTLERRCLLKWAMLLHDMGKPATRELKEPGRYRFHGHDHAGADLAEKLLKRLKFSRRDIQVISNLVDQHLRPLNLLNTEQRDYFKFFRGAGTEAIGTILISYGDISAARGPLADVSRTDEFLGLMNDLFRFYREEYYPIVHTPELIKGRDLMVLFQMKPGPQMGQVLKELREAQYSGRIRSREQAIEFAAQWLKSNSPNA